MKLAAIASVVFAAALLSRGQIPVVGTGQTGLAEPYRLPSNGVTVCVIPMVGRKSGGRRALSAQREAGRTEEQQTIARASRLLRRASRYLQSKGFRVVDGFVPWARGQLVSTPSGVVQAEVNSSGCGEGERYDLRLYAPSRARDRTWRLLPPPWRSRQLLAQYFLTVGAPANQLSRQGPYAAPTFHGVLASFVAAEQNPALAAQLRYHLEGHREWGIPHRTVSAMIAIALLQFIHGRLQRVQPGLPDCQLMYADGFYADCRFAMSQIAPNGQPYLADYPVFFRPAEDGPVELPAGNFVVRKVGRPRLVAPETAGRERN